MKTIVILKLKLNLSAFSSIEISIHQIANPNQPTTKPLVKRKQSLFFFQNPHSFSRSFSPVSAHSTANRRIKICPICGEQNFSRLSHHLTVAHNLNRAESLALLAYPDRNNNNTHSSIATVSGSSPINSTANQFDKSPQQTPISINTNNQQITSTHSSPSIHDTENRVNLIQSSPTEQQSANGLSIDGKKRLLCPCCDTWVLNLTDHLIKKHHLSSKQERLPFLRLARNRQSAVNGEKSSTNSFLISPLDQQQQTNSSEANKKYQNIIKKYQKKPFYSHPASSSSTLLNQESSATNSNQNLLAITNPINSSKQISPSRSSSKDVSKTTPSRSPTFIFLLRREMSIKNSNNVCLFFVNNSPLLLPYKIPSCNKWNCYKKVSFQLKMNGMI